MKIIAVGKTENDFAKIIADYEKRLPKNWAIEWKIIPYSRKSGDDARREETAKIREKIQPGDYVILLDERGRELASPEFSRKIEEILPVKNVVFVLGGAYGVAEDFRADADFCLSFSKMVFPHQIARLVLIEQIYRAWAISRNMPYHHV